MSRPFPVLVAALLVLTGIGALAAWSAGGDDAAPTTVATPPTTPVIASADTVPPTTTDPAECEMSIRLDIGVVDPEVACLEGRLVAAGVFDGEPDDVFDEATGAAVRAFQSSNGLLADGIAGPVTAGLLGNWIGGDRVPADPDTCDADGRSAVVDRAEQRAWLCDDGKVTREMPMTSAISQPDVGVYEVYAKDLNAASNFGGAYSTMTHFVAFTHGKYQGARIAFHSLPKYADGEFVQPPESVGDLGRHGDSSGCIRVLPDDAVAIWDALSIGDTVRVVS